MYSCRLYNYITYLRTSLGKTGFAPRTSSEKLNIWYSSHWSNSSLGRYWQSSRMFKEISRVHKVRRNATLSLRCFYLVYSEIWDTRAPAGRATGRPAILPRPARPALVKTTGVYIETPRGVYTRISNASYAGLIVQRISLVIRRRIVTSGGDPPATTVSRQPSPRARMHLTCRARSIASQKVLISWFLIALTSGHWDEREMKEVAIGGMRSGPRRFRNVYCMIISFLPLLPRARIVWRWRMCLSFSLSL